MKKYFLRLLPVLALMLLLAAPALAQTYTLSNIYASVTLEDGVYDAVLTPDNLSANSAFIAEQGIDFDALQFAFDNEGILLQAYDVKNGRTLVITALKTVDSETYFDLNLQDEEMRKEFRVSHTNGTVYSVLGYTYSTAKWANYGTTTQRFLQTQYSLRENGTQVCTGYQRRSIRNGYTITLDMQVRGRAAKESDNTALEKVMKTFAFQQILPMPDLPIKLSLSSQPPSETSTDSFTIKGTTAKNASVTVTVFSLGTTGGDTYSVTASKGGAFTVPVTLPEQGVYSVSILAEAEGCISAQKSFSVTYERGVLPVSLTIEPSSFLSDETVVAGSTVAGAKIQVSTSGPITSTKSATGANFTVKVDTSAEGDYTIVVSVTKKGLNDRVFTYVGNRTYSAAEKEEKFRASAQKATYGFLKKSSNNGKTVRFTGYITDLNQAGDEWVVSFAMGRTSGVYKDELFLICKDEPAYGIGAEVKVYGTLTGTYTKLLEGGVAQEYPRVEAAIIELP